MVVNRDTIMVLDWPGSVAYFERANGFVHELGRPSALDGPYSLDYPLSGWVGTWTTADSSLEPSDGLLQAPLRNCTRDPQWGSW